MPSAVFRFSVTDFLPAFWARNDAPMCLAFERGIGAELARQVAAVGHLDLDDVGAEQGQLVGAERTGQDVGQVEDADPASALLIGAFLATRRRRQRCTNGFGTSRSEEIQTHLVCRYSLIVSVPDSRPMPDSL